MLFISSERRNTMSDRVVPDLKTAIYSECAIENDIGVDDIDWCTGFWNEMDGEITPSLYPDSPIFSSKEYNWDDPVFLENVFVTPDIEEIFAGTHMNGHPSLMENQKNEDVNSVYSSSNRCEPPDSILQVRPPSNPPKQKHKRPRKAKESKTESTQDIPSKRQKTKRTKSKTKK